MPKLVNEKPIELGMVDPNAVDKGVQFIDAMIADEHSYGAIMENFRKLLVKHAIECGGTVEAAARNLKTHRNVFFAIIRGSRNRKYFAKDKL